MAGAPRQSVDPRLRVLYLVLVAVGAFFLKDVRFVLALAVSHAGLWLLLKLGARRLVRQTFKLWGFAAFVTASYALTAEDPSVDRWLTVDTGAFKLPINLGGAIVGIAMVLRVLVVVLASGIARAGDERAIAAGLRRLGTPVVVASSIDAVLALLGGGGGGGGRGRGGGGGGGGGRGRRHQGDEPKEGFLASLKKIAAGDVGPIVERMDRHIWRAEQYLEEEAYAQEEERLRSAGAGAGADAGRRADAGTGTRDIAVIVGLSLTMLGIKALKVLPSIPFAPGHKLVLLTPLYVVATLRTRTRFGATLTGLVMGTVAFLLGDGRYGIFEIAKHVVPGVVSDLVVPLVAPRVGSADADGERGAAPRKTPHAFVWSLVGGLMGVGRFATIFTVTLSVQAPAVAWAFLAPGLIIHTTFGVLSGLVSAPLIRAVLTTRDGRDEAPDKAA